MTETEPIAVALDVVMRELAPPAATFFTFGTDGEIRSSHSRGPDVPARETWPPSSDDDVQLPIRDGERLVAGVMLWRALGSPVWDAGRLRLAAALQPLIELAYVSAVRGAVSVDARLPATLTRRQRQVARMLTVGATNAEIARALDISANTAKSHTRAALAKLGVASRRELVRALTRDRTGVASGRKQGDRTAEQLLSLVLDWAAERIGAVAGGCALLSARLEPIADACATARGTAAQLDRALVRRLQRRLFPGAGLSDALRRALGERPRSPVLELDLSEADPNLGQPLLTVLRPQGRVMGLIWLAGDGRRAVDLRDATQALRAVHPLLELAYATPLSTAQAPISSLGDLAERGLTERELAVARLALDGQGNADIAATLGITQSTVKHHMGRILAKCGVRSRTQLIALVGDGAD
jgi:DNA-binding NarL/FixJ family response regulator